MVTDDQIAKAFKGTRFGVMENPVADRRYLLAQTIFKRIANYQAGNTITIILQELGFTKTLGGTPVKEARRWAYHEYHLPHN